MPKKSVLVLTTREVKMKNQPQLTTLNSMDLPPTIPEIECEDELPHTSRRNSNEIRDIEDVWKNIEYLKNKMNSMDEWNKLRREVKELKTTMSENWKDLVEINQKLQEKIQANIEDLKLRDQFTSELKKYNF